MVSVWNIKEIELSDSMRTSIDSYFRARSDLQRQYASVGLMNHIKKYLINLENEEKESLKNGRGYYYPSKGSGKPLLDGIKQIYFKEIPIFLYGFSGGAHFVARFAEWVPDRVAGFCAYSAAWWDDPKSLKNAPLGIIACGENDERLGASLSYFLDGRKLNKKWVWVKIPDIGHSRSAKLESFVRDFFKCIIYKAAQNDVWVDITNGETVFSNTSNLKTALTCHLPDKKLIITWKELNGIK